MRRSPRFAAARAYLPITLGAEIRIASSSSPFASLVVIATTVRVWPVPSPPTKTNRSGLLSRAARLSVLGSYRGLRTSVRVRELGGLSGLIVLQDAIWSLSEPWIMYGPDEITSCPYLPG